MTSYRRPVFSIDFSGFPNASSWPTEYFKVLTSTTGASATIANGVGLLNLGTVGSYGASLLMKLWGYPIEGDKFELLTKFKVIDTGATIWVQHLFRSGNESQLGDTSCVIEVSPVNYNWSRRVGFSFIQGPLNAWTLSANQIMWLRMRVIGGKHMARTWQDGTAEPQTWHKTWMNDDGPRYGKWYLQMGASDGANRQIGILRLDIDEIGDVYEPILSNSDTTVFNGTGAQTAFVTPHFLDGTPTRVTVTPQTAASAGTHYVTWDATNITVTYTTAPASGTGNVILAWRAEA